jgi:His-Xaa-Ser system radical SAM maturase HxsB
MPAVSAERPPQLGFFRWGQLDRGSGRHVLSNDAGDWLVLSSADWADLLNGRAGPGHPRHADLVSGGFLRDGADLDALASRLARRKAHLTRGPHLHVVVVTLRCNQRCVYCHASRREANAAGVDMDEATARRVAELALESSAPHVEFEFQGGEPTLNMSAVRALVEHASRLARGAGKSAGYSMVSNLTALSDADAEWLIERGVLMCTSLDGPADLHDRNRPWPGGAGSPHGEVLRRIAWFHDRYARRGLDPRLWHVDALATVTRATLGRFPDLVQTYVDVGIRALHLRPLNPFGLAVPAWRRIGYSSSEFLTAWEGALDHLIARNLAGTEIVEGTAALVLTKLLSHEDPGYVDLQSPCGAGTGQIAYGPDGTVHPCDEARMAAAMGEPMFALGNVRQLSMRELLRKPTVRALAAASLQDSLPGCASCWNLPFCGVCPLHDWSTQGTLFGQRPRSERCARQLGISTALLRRLDDDRDGSLEAVFRRWTVRRPRESGNGCA